MLLLLQLYKLNFNKIKNSILNILFKLNDDLVVYSGHGDETTMKKVKEESKKQKNKVKPSKKEKSIIDENDIYMVVEE